MTSRDWALAYAELGWRVFPLIPGGKRPLYRGWQRDATTDPDLIARCWRREPGPNIAVICGQAFDAFDIEAAHLPALRAWIERLGYAIPDTPIARTGRGGVHILVRPTGGRGRVLRLDGVRVGELKAAGGFIVVCPSRTTAPYGWHRSPLDVEIAEAPAWLRALVAQPPAARAGSEQRVAIGPSQAVALVRGLFRMVAGASEGERNSMLFWAACRVAEQRLDPSAASDILLAAALRAGLPADEARRTIASGLDR